MPSFNLVDEPWIPCELSGGHHEEQGLRFVLCEAHGIRSVWDPSPLVTVALQRLLLAVLHRCFGPPDLPAWQALWEEGRFDRTRVDAYLDRWRHRFDLFDAKWPGYQVRPLHEVVVHPAAQLSMEAASGHNPTLFDHSVDAAPRALLPAEAARYVLARQAYSIGFGKSAPFYFQDGPLTRGYSVLAHGPNLFETLMLNLLPSGRWTMESRDNDAPAWEQEQLRRPEKTGTPPRGRLDYLTWQSRRLHLIPEPDGTVRHCQVLQNLKLPDDTVDPFKTYRKDATRGWRPRLFEPARSLWRDSHILFEEARTEDKRPAVFDFLAELEQRRRRGLMRIQPVYRFAAYGFATDRGKAASVIMWREERLPLALAYLTERALLDGLRAALATAEHVATALHRSGQALARFLLAPAAAEPRAHKPDPADVRRLAQSFGLRERFWPMLEGPARRFLADLPADVRGPPGDEEYGATELPCWAETVTNAARGAFAAVAQQLDISARSLKAVVAAERVLGRGLARALEPYRVAPKPALTEADA